MTSASFGRVSQVNIGTGTASRGLGFAGNEAATGQTWRELLSSTASSSRPWQRPISLGVADQRQHGRAGNPLNAARGFRPGGAVSSLNVTQGLASSLNTAYDLLDPVSGRLKAHHDGFTQSINTIKSSITQENAYIVESSNRCKSFRGLEATISKLQSIGNFLTSQFTSTTSVKQTGGITQPVSSSSSTN